ncbi:MAG TPA: sensor domain-containing diguanylate cyclase [Anaeromyxobacteraceae bacterium]|nr:sensor domain-containing diguanylate cyclase [Anaeromyxobacteraceae bacterium]
MLRSVQRSIGLKLAVAVAVPSLGVALAAALSLRHGRLERGSPLEPAIGVIIGALVVFAVAMAVTYLLALRRFAALHERRAEDARSIAAMKRELALNAALEARVRELTLLHDLSRALASTLEPEQVVRHVEALVGRTLPLDRLEIRLPERSGRASEVAAGGVGPGASAGSVGAAQPERRRLEIPMVHDGRRVGALVLFRTAPGRFSAEEVNLLESIASQAALALTNARLHQEVVRQSLTDALTGIANRRALFSRLQLEIERCDRFDETLGVAVVDVDHFKRLNDRYGHPTGDAILREVASVLAGSLRKVDFVARYGGEEFAVVLPGAGRDATLAVGEKLRGAVAAARFDHHGAPTDEVVTISVGTAIYPLDARDLSALVDCADAALYAAKRAGRNAVRAHQSGMREHPGRERDVSITAGIEPPEE